MRIDGLPGHRFSLFRLKEFAERRATAIDHRLSQWSHRRRRIKRTRRFDFFLAATGGMLKATNGEPARSFIWPTKRRSRTSYAEFARETSRQRRNWCGSTNHSSAAKFGC